MTAVDESLRVADLASLARHLAFSPVAFAVTEGSTHLLRYANAAFQCLVSEGQVAIGLPDAAQGTTDLTPVLDRAFLRGGGGEIIRDEIAAPSGSAVARWSCTVWPVASTAPAPKGLVMEVRDVALIEGARSRQRAITEGFLLAALREQGTAAHAIEAGDRATFLADASRDLAMSLDQNATRDIVRRSALPREGTWCIVDIIESNGAVRRLAVVHPDASKHILARALADHWVPKADDLFGALGKSRSAVTEPKVITHESCAALLAAAHGPENLAILEALGFGSLLVVQLVVRATVLGAITFVTREGDDPLSPDEIALASDLAARCAMALDNARLYRDADGFRASADLASRAQSDFLGTVSHALQTPLRAIGDYAKRMKRETRGPETPEQRTDLARINRDQEHLLSLISDIRTFVRSESGRMEHHFADVPVQFALHDVAELLGPAVKKGELALDERPGDANSTVWADPDRVRQILLNLVTNAVNYTPVGGRITLSSTVTPKNVVMQVADTGPGIPADKLEAIFDPFVQLGTGLGNHHAGAGPGLGLAISRDLAGAMRGNLMVESTFGAGSRFMLTLPRAPQEPGPLN